MGLESVGVVRQLQEDAVKCLSCGTVSLDGPVNTQCVVCGSVGRWISNPPKELAQDLRERAEKAEHELAVTRSCLLQAQNSAISLAQALKAAEAQERNLVARIYGTAPGGGLAGLVGELTQQRDEARAEADELSVWQVAVAEGLGFLNRPEGQSGHEAAPADVIVHSVLGERAELSGAEDKYDSDMRAVEAERDGLRVVVEALHPERFDPDKDPEGPPTCAQCGDEYTLTDYAYDPTAECDACAHKILDEVRALAREAIALGEELKEEASHG